MRQKSHRRQTVEDLLDGNECNAELLCPPPPCQDADGQQTGETADSSAPPENDTTAEGTQTGERPVTSPHDQDDSKEQTVDVSEENYVKIQWLEMGPITLLSE